MTTHQGIAALLLGSLCAAALSAQPQLNHPKKHYVDSLSRYYVQESLPLYFFVATSPNGEHTPISAYEGKAPEAIYLDGHGKHNLRHVDLIHNTTQNFVLFADGIAPISSAVFKVPGPEVDYGMKTEYRRGDVQYYGKNLRVSLSSKDEMSGVEELYYAINGAPYQPYGGTLSFDAQGPQTLRYYAVDHVGNAAQPTTRQFIVDVVPPQAQHSFSRINTRDIIAPAATLRLSISDDFSGSALTQYRFDDGPWVTYKENSEIPVAKLDDGEHRFTYFSVDHVGNVSGNGYASFYLDKLPPIISADILGDRFLVNGQTFFSGRTKMRLTALDNKSGVERVLFAIDNDNFGTYADPFYLPQVPGEHYVKYYAVDSMGNAGVNDRRKQEEEYTYRVDKIFLDLIGPQLVHSYEGRTFQKGEAIFIHPSTRIKLAAKDGESGLQNITYQVNGEAGELEYASPFAISKPGRYVIDYYGYDNVNNRNTSGFDFTVDGEGPDIFHYFSIDPTGSTADGRPIVPAYSTLFLAATDKLTGTDRISYEIDGKPLPYTGLINKLKPNRDYRVVVRAVDMLGNEKETSINFRTDSY